MFYLCYLFLYWKKLLPLTTSEVTTLRHDTNMFIIIIIIITVSEKQRMDGLWVLGMLRTVGGKKGKGSPYSITKCRVPELIPVLGSQPAGGVSHKPDGRLPLLSARPAVTPATLKRAATNSAAW